MEFSLLVSQILENTRKVVQKYQKTQGELKLYKVLVQGETLQKYTYKHGKKQTRYFSMSPDLEHLQWRLPNSQRKLRRYPISEISRVTSGNHFFSSRNSKANMRTDDENCCFSIHLNSRTVDLVASSEDQRNLWVKALCMAIKPKSDLKDLRDSETEIQKLSEEITYKYNELEQQNSQLKLKLSKLEHLNKEKSSIEVTLQGKDQGSMHSDNSTTNKDEEINNLRQKVSELEEQLRNQSFQKSEKLVQLETNLTEKAKEYTQLSAEYEEFKKQIKEAFNKSLVQKVQHYKEAKDVLSSYVSIIKSKLENLEKELTIWQSVVYSYALPVYQNRNPSKIPQFKEVLSFAMDSMERKLEDSQVSFLKTLTEATKTVKA